MAKAMAPHSSTLAWKIPWAEEPGGLQSMGSLRVRHDWATSLSLFHEEAELWLRSRRDLTNAHGAHQLLERLGKKEKHLDIEVSFRSWPPTWLLQPTLVPYFFSPRYFQISHRLRHPKVQVELPCGIWSLVQPVWSLTHLYHWFYWK